MAVGIVVVVVEVVVVVVTATLRRKVIRKAVCTVWGSNPRPLNKNKKSGTENSV